MGFSGGFWGRLLRANLTSGDIRVETLDAEGGRNEWVRVLLNGRDVRFLPECAQGLKDGDVVHIMPTLGGG